MSDLFVVKHKKGKAYTAKFQRDVPEQVCLFESNADAAEFVRRNGLPSHRISLATPAEIGQGVLVQFSGEHIKMQKSESRICLVELFEDFNHRRFAIESRAKDEKEFLIEFSHAYAMLPEKDLESEKVRIRQFAALCVEVCCRYRGYKTDRVEERKVLLAGDLDFPSIQLASQKIETHIDGTLKRTS